MWEIFLNQRVIFGLGKIAEIPELVKQLKIQRPFIVTSPSQMSVTGVLAERLAQTGLQAMIYSDVKTEPELAVINHGAKLLAGNRCDGVIGIGGGSVLDAAKAIAMLATNSGLIEEFQMGEKAITEPTLPTIMVPTTAGTGSEATKVSVVFNNNNGLKKSVYSPYMIADVAILDPQLTVSSPSRLTASTGMDALSHAVESYVSLNATPMTEMFGLKAMELINRSVLRAVTCGEDLEARSDMLLASFLAGCALNAGIGVAHIIAQPFGGEYKVSHGDACSIFLPPAMEVNLEYSLKKYCRIAEALGVGAGGANEEDVAQAGINRVKEIRMQTGAPGKISEVMDRSHLDIDAAVRNIQGATGHIKCNPRLVDAKLLSEVIAKAL